MTEEEHLDVFSAVNGLSRWDDETIALVARALREGSMTKLTMIGLANLIDGSNPFGMQLKMKGQGNALTLRERAERVDRAYEVGGFIANLIQKGYKQEDALFDAEEEYGISPTTAWRYHQLYLSLVED